jgi:hypothetical protein
LTNRAVNFAFRIPLKLLDYLMFLELHQRKYRTDTKWIRRRRLLLQVLHPTPPPSNDTTGGDGDCEEEEDPEDTGSSVMAGSTSGTGPQATWR